MSSEPLIIEQEFNASTNQLWKAITLPELMKKWYFDLNGFVPKVGYAFQFEGGEENKRYVHLCEVIEAIPSEKLTYSWKYEGYTGISFVSFELAAVGEKTKLKLIHKGIESFDNPDFAKEKFVKGWTYLIQESLVNFVEKGEAMRYW